MFKHKDQRVGVFIDTQNMYYSARNLFKRKVNFKNIVEDAVAGRKLIRAMAYVVATEDGQEKPFFDALEKAGIETIAKDLQEYASGAKKADWDVGLAIDVVQMLDTLDVVVIASGDGDFMPLVSYVHSRGRMIEVMAFGQTTSGKLRAMVNDYIDLSANQRRYLIGPKLLGTKTSPTEAKTEALEQMEVPEKKTGDTTGFFMEIDETLEEQEQSRTRRLEF
ncbi:MAG: NYN domain-containing protein [Parcubacteria group bacterium]|nr:NYN domain-containing protein [Parcubacteria group bacterium]